MDFLTPPNSSALDANDEKELADRQLNAKRLEEEAKIVIRSILETPQGRRWMWNKLSACSIFATTFVHGDTHASAFNEGARNFGLQLLTEVVKADPTNFAVMQSEAQNG